MRIKSTAASGAFGFGKAVAEVDGGWRAVAGQQQCAFHLGQATVFTATATVMTLLACS
jgi:hypothetical protein